MEEVVQMRECGCKKGLKRHAGGRDRETTSRKHATRNSDTEICQEGKKDGKNSKRKKPNFSIYIGYEKIGEKQREKSSTTHKRWTLRCYNSNSKRKYNKRIRATDLS